MSGTGRQPLRKPRKKRIGKQPPPQALAYFLVLIEELETPPAIHRILTLLRETTFAPTDISPSFRERLNRRVGQTRRQHPEQFAALVSWVSTEGVLEACRIGGGLHAWQTCLQAFRAIARGEPAHKAFGMHRPGRPPSAQITPSQEAAALAAHLIQRGTSAEEAQIKARLVVDPDAEAEIDGEGSRLNRRTLQKHRRGAKVLAGFAETITKKANSGV